MTEVIRIHAFGSTDELRHDEVARPDPGPGELLVRVFAAGVNPVDCKIRSGALLQAEDLPLAMGREVAGVVEAVGEGVLGFAQGARVHAMVAPPHGGYARHAIVRSGAAAPVPGDLSWPEAAAVPLAGLTAWQGLLDHGGLREGQSVLIHGGAGGVGHFAVQIAKCRGATVAVTARGEDHDLLTQLGADRVIDHRDGRFEDEVSDVDLVLDLVGGATQDRSWPVLKRGGTLVSTVQEPDQDRARDRDARALFFRVQADGTQLAELGRLIARGEVRPVVTHVLPLDEAAAAHDLIEKEHTQGKIVLEVP